MKWVGFKHTSFYVGGILQQKIGVSLKRFSVQFNSEFKNQKLFLYQPFIYVFQQTKHRSVYYQLLTSQKFRGFSVACWSFKYSHSKGNSFLGSRKYLSVTYPEFNLGFSHDTHECLERKISCGLTAFYLYTSISCHHVSSVADPMV